MRLLKNAFRHNGLPEIPGIGLRRASTDPTEPLTLLRYCPVAASTPLLRLPGLAPALDVGEIFVKDESPRMRLGSFKALGAAYVIARDAASSVGGADALREPSAFTQALRGRVYTCASAGNHGLSVAAGAHIFGARAVIYLGKSVPDAFVGRLRRLEAEVVRVDGDYEASMAIAAKDASANGWVLLSDSSWPGYVDLPAKVMEGYLVMGAEIADEVPDSPDHIFLQAGVGGMAAAMAAYFRDRWGNKPTIVVVEPESAPALIESIRAGRPVRTNGPPSIMGRLDCKEPSYLALAELARHVDYFVTVDDAQCIETVDLLARWDISTTPSGAAGIAGLHHAGAEREALGLHGTSRVLAIVTEGREDTAPSQT